MKTSDRPDRLEVFSKDWGDWDDLDDHMETRLKRRRHTMKGTKLPPISVNL